MIKRVLNIFFLLNFVVATTGLCVTVHTCDMSNKKVALMCTGKADCKCCKTIYKYNRLSSDYSQINHNQRIEIPSTDFFILSEKLFPVFKINNAPEFYAYTSPPILKGELSFLQLFRI